MTLHSSRAETAAANILRYISDRTSVGDRLPSEDDLALMTGVSRTTVRDALQRLWLEGWISRRWGAGTFVRQLEDPHGRVAQTMLDLDPIGSLPDRIHQLGHDVEIATTHGPTPTSSESVLEVLGLPPGSQAWELGRTIVVDGSPGIHMMEYLPMKLGEVDVDPAPLLARGPSLAELSRAWGAPIERMDAQVDAATATPELATHLDVAEGTPLLRVHQQATTPEDVVVAYSVMHYRTDVVRWNLVRTLAR